MAFRFDKLTIKAQEAVARAQALAAERGNAADRSAAPAGRPAGRERRDRRAAAGADRRQPAAVGADRRVGTGPLPQGLRRGAAAGRPRAEPGARSRPARGRRDEGRVRLDRAPAAGPGQGRIEGQERAEAQRRHRQGDAAGPAGRPRQRAGDRSEPRGKVPGPASATASTWSSGPGRASSIR